MAVALLTVGLGRGVERIYEKEGKCRKGKGRESRRSIYF